MVFSLQQYANKYKESIIEMILQIQRDEYGLSITRKEQQDLENIPAFYQAEDGNFWVALLNEEVVGSVGVKDIGDGFLVLRKMFVKKEARGKEFGVSKALLEQALFWAKEKKKKALYLGTTDKFIAAHRFYEKYGFIKVEKENLPSNFPLMSVDTVFYKFEISNSL